jgi:thiosulfate reductase cytochrome b subunit/cytochrome c553
MVMRTRPFTKWILPGFFIALAAVLFVLGRAAAQEDTAPAPTGGSPIHPVFPLLDAAGDNVLESGEPLSTMTTCGGCHDTAFIAANNFHADAGLSDYTDPGTVPGGRPWDTSQGLFGKWSPILYRYLSPEGDPVTDLTTPAWIQLFSARHTGGGPAETSRQGTPLASLSPDAANPETAIVDPTTGQTQPWDWSESGTAEINCFVCHWPGPNKDARLATLGEGKFDEAINATLLGSGLVEQNGDGWQWNAEAFDVAGNLKQDFVRVQDPTVANCGTCHGVTHNDLNTPLTLDDFTPGEWHTLTTGQVMSPQRLDASGLNLADKSSLSRSWDIHMERVLACTDCHYSLNNPVYYQETGSGKPEHLTFDPRRIDLGEYIYRPLHQFAKGQSAQGTLAPNYDGTLRRCESCHSLETTHNWLPYKDRHTAAASCETCHVPKLYAPALEYIDWTVLKADGEPVTAYRGMEGDTIDAGTLMSGYEPVLLPRDNRDGTTTLAPFNLVSAWYWVYGDPPRPVPERDLQAAFFEGEDYAPDILAAFDRDGNGQLSTTELNITTDAQTAAVAGRLAARGLANPRIEGEVQPFGVNHNVAGEGWATKDCRTCHGEDSRLAAPIDLADRTPGGVQPALYEGGPVSWPGSIESGEGGSLAFTPSTSEAGLYILGHNASTIINWLGALMILGVSLGVVVHSGLRYFTARARAKAMVPETPVETQKVYMYDVYERLWHWLQTAAILLLLFTGLIIHKPDMFGMFSFSYVVQVHNILALLLIINAALSLFYHLASGEIKQFIPRPRGFFDQAFQQAIFYLRGIFNQEPHPFEKTPDRKMNPLQQVTYLMILNVLLPLQILTGALMWGAQRWPNIVNWFGGLPVLGPVHTLVAWTFAAFIILHVYLTTTGPEPLTGMKAMVMGYEDVEVHAGDHEGQAAEGQPALGATD